MCVMIMYVAAAAAAPVAVPSGPLDGANCAIPVCGVPGGAFTGCAAPCINAGVEFAPNPPKPPVDAAAPKALPPNGCHTRQDSGSRHQPVVSQGGKTSSNLHQFDRAGSARLPQRPRRRELKSDQKCLWHQNQLRPRAARTRRTRRPSTQQERQTQSSQQVPPHQTPHLRKRYPQTPRTKLLAQMLVQL